MPWSSVHDYIFLGVDALLVGVLFDMYRRRDTIIKNILKAPAVSVGPQLNLLFDDNTQSTIPYAVVTGKVQDTTRGIIDSPSGLKGVLQVITVNEHSVRRHAFGHWGDSVRRITQTKNGVPFGLKGLTSSSQGVILEVESPFEAISENLLQPVSTNFNPTNATVASTLMGFFTGVASKGIESTEEFLPLDAFVTGIGQVTKEGAGQYKLSPPLEESSLPYMLTSLTSESLVKKLESRRNVIKFFAFVFLAVGILVGGRRLHKLWRYYETERMRERILKRRSEIETQGLSDAQICIICLSNPREVILLDCGHVCVCADCVDKLDGKCPVCRNTIVTARAAYIV